MSKYELDFQERMRVRKVVVSYCGEIAEFMKTVQDQVLFVNNMINNHKQTLDFLAKAANEHLENRESVEYVSQRIINIAYETFYAKAPYFMLMLKELENIVDEPDAFLNEHLKNVIAELLPDTVKMKVLGYRKEYVPTHVEYETSQCDVDNYESVEHIFLYVEDEEEHIYEMDVFVSEEECYSGWCAADYGCCDITRVERVEVNARPKRGEDIVWECPIKDYIDELKDLEVGQSTTMSLYDNDIEIENVLTVSRDGGDYYYPSGYVEFKDDLFEPLSARQYDKAVVWVFKGGSGLGKSYLASRVKDKEVFETDAYKELPEKILADIIVLGNKYSYTVEELSERIPYEHEIIEVDFSK